jgi:hypothetical protein
MNKANEEEPQKCLEGFVRQSSLVILKSRICCPNWDNIKDKSQINNNKKVK